MQYCHRDQHTLRLPHAHLRWILPKEVIFAGQADTREGTTNRGVALLCRSGCVSPPGLAQLRANLQRWIERRQRALQNQSDLSSAYVSQLALAEFQQISALKINRTFYARSF